MSATKAAKTTISKMFSEGAWEKDLPSIGTSFCFSTKSIKKNQDKKSSNGISPKEQSSQGKNEPKKQEGWSVLLQKQDGTLTNGKNDSKGKKRKASHECNAAAKNGENEGKSPNKKVKQNKADTLNGALGKKAKHSTENEAQHSQRPMKQQQNKLSKNQVTPVNTESLRDKLIERLKGSRFRFINEQLYKTTGEEAKKLFQEDPESFSAYHEGYRHQIAQWSMNPLDRIIKSICKLPKDAIVADFGCGEARLAASIPNKTYSLDLVSHNSSVVACDMANTPLESNFVNVVVFCLSLMGTNLVDFLLEANRVLKVGGVLKIAEVSSRFDNVNEFVGNVQKCGFKLVNKDMKHKLFYFFNFKKDRTVIRGSIKIKQFSLKPCLYKKR